VCRQRAIEEFTRMFSNSPLCNALFSAKTKKSEEACLSTRQCDWCMLNFLRFIISLNIFKFTTETMLYYLSINENVSSSLCIIHTDIILHCWLEIKRRHIPYATSTSSTTASFALSFIADKLFEMKPPLWKQWEIVEVTILFHAFVAR
jgi:hypothetical protein